MKKILSIILFTAAVFGTTSCVSEEDLLFEKSAAERLNEASEVYSQRLLASPNGWVFEYYPQTSISKETPIYGAGYLMLLKFTADHSVVVGMKNTFSSGAYLEDKSAWEVITDNGPVLSFNTFNKCIHAFSNPEDVAGTSEDETGKGMLGDYEFVMVDVPEDGDYISLKGKKRGTYSLLTKIEEPTDFEAYLLDCQKKRDELFPTSVPNHVIMQIAGKEIIMENMSTGIPEYYFSDEDKILTSQLNAFIFSKHGDKYYARFKNSFTAKDDEDVKVQDFVFDEASQSFVGTDDSSIKIVGPDANAFLYDRLSAGASLTFNSSTEASADLTDPLTEIRNAFSAVSYTFNTIIFKKGDEGMRAAVNYRNAKKQNVTTYYNVNMSRNTDGTISFQYAGPANESGTTLLNSIPAIETFLKNFEGSYKVESAQSPLNLSQVKFSSGAKYFVLSPNYPKSEDAALQ